MPTRENESQKVENALFDNIPLNESSTEYNTQTPFPNSINNLSWYLDCGSLNFDKLNSAGYNTGHFYHFDEAFTDSGDAGLAVGAPLCVPCSENNLDNLRGNNQINVKSWLGWNPDNSNLNDGSHDVINHM